MVELEGELSGTDTRDFVLLDVCPPGKICRQEEKTRFKKATAKKWQDLIDDFKLQIAEEIETTKGRIEVSHEVFVQC